MRPLREALLRSRALLLVMGGWVLFRAVDIEQAFGMLTRMIVPHGFGLDLATDVALTRQRLAVIVLASTVVLLPRSFVVGHLLEGGRGFSARLARLTVTALGTPVAALLVAAGTFSPFLYYQF